MSRDLQEVPVCSGFRFALVAFLVLAPPNVASASASEPWVNIGPYGGPVLRVVTDPSDPSTLFCAMHDAGVFKSTNGGLSWFPSRSGFGIYAGGVTGTQGIAIDPLAPHVLYGASGNNGIYKSVDQGSTWSHLSTAPFRKDLVWNVACDPSLEGTVYAGTLSSSPYVSRDGGETWFRPRIEGQVAEPDFLEFAADPRGPGVVFAAGGINGVYVTSDYGASWRPQMTGMLQKENVRDVAISPLDPNVVFVLVQGKNTLYRSVDGGQTWAVRQRAPRHLGQRKMLVFVQGPDAPAPGALAILIGQQYGLIISYDEGLTWQDSSAGLPPELRSGLGLRPTDFAWHPARVSVVFAASDSGLFTSEDGGRSWKMSQYGISNVETFDVAIDPRNPDWACVLTAGPAVPEAEIQTTWDRGISWQRQTSGFGGLRFVAMAQHLSRPETLHVAAYWNNKLPRVYRSDDYGLTWYHVFLPRRGRTRVQFVRISPSDPNTVFLGGHPSLEDGTGINVIYRTTDGGKTWKSLTRIPDPLTTLAIDPNDQSTLYVGTTWYGKLYKSTDGGSTWTRPGVEPWLNDNVNMIVIDPQQTNIVYAATDAGIFKSTDAGASWRSINEGLVGIYGVLSVTAIAIDPTEPNIVYVGLAGPRPLYKSTDRGEHWKPVSEGLHSDWVRALAISPINPKMIYAATGTSGLFMTTTGGE